ncbi:hypothetical protein [Methanobrevibacter sp. V74]|uniref:hypothetical protein n=1 Tax=Methanobrevibacter sp. V74 TaxID=3064279 RepID=UPI002736EBC3|nr:hypothetical protein [Methanobrevibacter sp. V74]
MVKHYFLWETPITHKWNVVDVQGYVYGDGDDPQKAIDMALGLNISKEDINTEGIL